MSLSVEALTERDRIYLLYRQGPVQSLVALVAGGVVIVAMWRSVPHAWLWAWIALMAANQAVRIELWRRFHLEKPEGARIAVWAGRYTAGMAVGGALFGSMGPFMMPFATPIGEAILLLVTSMAAGTVAANAAHRPAVRAYLFASLTPMSLALAYLALTQGSLEYWVQAFLFAFYFAVLLVFGRDQVDLLRNTIEVSHRNDALLAELREKTALAERASLAKSKFFAAASHDLRQPLQALGLFAASMHGNARDADDERRTGRILASVDALESLFDELLDISKLDAGNVVPAPVHFAVRGMFDRLASIYSPLAEESGLALAFEPGEAVAFTDPVLLERIVGNLVSNAIRYTPTGEVNVRCIAHGGRIAIEVADTGVGIPAEEHERVFDEFYQLGNPERDRKKGLGLGLATVRRMAALLECPVRLESAPGRGSVFTVEIPAGEAGKIVSAAAEGAPASSDVLGGKVIAVLDDEREVREGLVELLLLWGCRVVDAGSTAELQEKLAAAGRAPDALIADYRLRNHETGVAAIEGVRARFGSALPALLMSGDTSAQIFGAAREAGLTLLSKPVRPARLRAGLQNALRSGNVVA